MTHRVAVYGSLKKCFGNHRLLEGQEYVGVWLTPPEYTMYNLGAFPAVVPRGKTSIVCELYDVDDGCLSRLDMLEGHPDFYERVDVSTPFGEGVQMYLFRNRISGNRTRDVVANGFWWD